MSLPGMTPGPWHARPCEAYDGPHVPGSWTVRHGSGWIVSQVDDETDARAIAAVPEMLACLEDAYNAYMGIPAGEDWPGRARAALAKARGEEGGNGAD